MTQAAAETARISALHSHLGYRVAFEPGFRHIQASFNGQTIVDSTRVMIMRETGYPPIFYFPRDDVRMDLMTPSKHTTFCPFKGNASHWDLTVGDRRSENIMWSYNEPFSEVKKIREYVSLTWEAMDSWTADGDELDKQSREAWQPKVASDTGILQVNPFVEWMLREGGMTTSPEELIRGLAHAFIDNGITLDRLMINIQTLHPLMFATAYIWWRDEDDIEVRQVPHHVRGIPQFTDSPIALIFNGHGGIRRCLKDDEPLLDFPVLREMKDKGVTDYVAMPMNFSNGQINCVTLTTDSEDAFSTDVLGKFYEILPVLGRLFEAFTTRETALTLMETYLGKQTGRRVLEGLIQRGDGEAINAVIWFCDLRNSTPLARSMSRPDYLSMLNRFLECMAGAVLDNDGEVLRFVGDAVLAIFPIQKQNCPAGTNMSPAQCEEQSAKVKACEQAIMAVRQARGSMVDLNRERQQQGLSPLGYGIGLHLGEIMYGNIGTPERLEFTVIGEAANEAARVEGMTKTLGKKTLLSAKVAECYGGPLVSTGVHALRGVDDEMELFVLPEEDETS